MSPGRGNAGHCAVTLYVGEGPRGSNGSCFILHRISVTSSAPHNQIGPLWCWFPSGWACAHSRPLWVSPTTSPVRLGVSPAAAPTPRGVFNQRFEALFPPSWSPGLRHLFCSPAVRPGLSMHECGATGPACHHFVESASCSLACPVRPTICHPFGSSSIAGSPLCPACPSPTLLLVWMMASSLSPWLLDFRAV